jgi:hypothetical protein
MSDAPRSPTRPYLRLAAVTAVLAVSGCRCGTDEPPSGTREGVVEHEPSRADPMQAGPPARSRQRLVVADAAELASVELGPVERLDLALSGLDLHERPRADSPSAAGDSTARGDEARDDHADSDAAGSDGDPTRAAVLANPRCAGLDLHDIAARAPNLSSLRISGCQAAVHAGLSAFGERLRELELADLELDAVTIARLSQLHGLERLTLTRVHAEPDALKPLGRKISPQTVVLRELGKRSAVAELFGILPDIREIRLIGPWANHDTMIQVGKAKRLERLAVLDTEIGNYSLHQIKPLERLHRLEWSGPGFNDTSPVFLKDLPIDELVCDCPRFGDRGLHHLYLFPGLRVLELERSAITSAGLIELGAVQKLEALTLRYVDLDADAFTALAQLPALARLVLGPGQLLDPKASGLGDLLGLRELIIELDGFGDPAAPQLASLVALEHLDLGNTSISDEGLAHLAPLTKLRRLELHHSRVTKHGLAHLTGMTALEVLELDHTDVVDEGVAHLAVLSSLRELRLDRTLITDAALVHVAMLSKLERLNLADTVVTREGLAALEGLKGLEAVNLAGTRAAGGRSP